VAGKDLVGARGLLLPALWFAFAASGCASAVPKTAPATRAPAATGAPTLDQLKSAPIAGVYDAPVTLKNGSYEGAPFVADGVSRPTLQLISELVAFGDLDGAPGDEAAALLAGSSGGSGERIYLAVIGLRDGKPVSLAVAEVGDRTRIRSFGISGADVVMDVVETGPSEPACCPSQLARKTYSMAKGSLAMKKSDVTGTLSLATLAGAEWLAVEIDGKPLTETPKPPTATFEAGRIAGFSGCNRYTGSIRETGPGEIAIGPIAGTRMACPEAETRIEARFLASLAKTTHYGFRAGKLQLSGLDGDATRSVLFVRN